MNNIELQEYIKKLDKLIYIMKLWETPDFKREFWQRTVWNWRVWD